MPPKRMSDILHSSSIDARISSPLPTAATDTSDSPTLPILGASEANKEASKREHGTKRKRTTDAPTQSKKAAIEGKKTNHPALYTPWLLLPPKQRRDIEERKDEVEVIVYSKNQNVKAGIGRLVRCVGAAQAESDKTVVDQEVEDVNDEEKMIVVSAQGEGTAKLVGIVDMVRRIVAEHNKGEEKNGGEEGTKWYTYTVLSNVEIVRPSKTLGEAQRQEQGGEEVNDDEAEAMDVDEEGGAVQETQQSKEEEMRKVPVLSVWISRKRMVGWREAFGEQEMAVYKAVG
ncbi:hypothetical protein N0V87_003832 [Didymella glomerata]|uniref:DNA/RNA-binding protein Alba-like domain-containing protein n=1 Tax=Didymella glomerata TaxID=749621 RepID=A0A9W8X1L5_9PLEO|nr:hypothetical protein N0V87_003832 [Didymella glomerata]